jgi:hypothetical protein
MDRDATYFEQEAIWAADLHAGERDCIGLIERFWPADAHTMLDAGAGAGRLLNNLSIPAATWACDLSVTALRKVQAPAAAARVTKLPFRNRTFDLTLCSNVLEHLSDADLEIAFAELERVSSKYVLIVSPIHEPMQTQLTLCHSCGCQFHPNGHRRSFTPADFEKAMPGFQTEVVSFFAEPFLVTSLISASAERALGNDLHAFAGALCPNCGWIAPESPPAPQVGAGLWDLGLEPGAPNDASLRLPSSALVLLRRANPENRAADGAAPLSRLRLQSATTDAVSATLRARSPGVIHFDTRLDAIGPAVDAGCLVVETGSAWHFDKNSMPYMAADEEEDRYALFLVPAAQALAADAVTLQYSGGSSTGVELQLYDAISGYIPLGTFGEQAEPGEEGRQTTSLALPALVRPGGLMAIFRLFLPRGGTGRVAFEHIALSPGGEGGSLEITIQNSSHELPLAEAAREFEGSFAVTSDHFVKVTADATALGCRTGSVWLGEGQSVSVPAWLFKPAAKAPARSIAEQRITLRLGEDLRRLLWRRHDGRRLAPDAWAMIVDSLARISGLETQEIWQLIDRPEAAAKGAVVPSDQLTALNEAAAALNQLAEETEAKRVRAETLLIERDGTIAELSAEMKRLTDHAGAIEARRAEAELALKDRDKTIAALSEKHAQLVENANRVEERRAKTDALLQERDAMIARLSAEHTQATEEANTIEARRAKADALLQERDAMIARLSAEHTQATEEANTIEARRIKAEAMLKERDTTIAGLSAEAERLKALLEAGHVEREQSAADKADREIAVSRLTTDLARLEADAWERSAVLQSVKEETERVLQTLAQRDKDVGELNERVHTLATRYRWLETARRTIQRKP